MCMFLTSMCTSYFFFLIFFYFFSFSSFFFFFFNDTATTEIYTLSLHDALPISSPCSSRCERTGISLTFVPLVLPRSEEHTSELQSQFHLVCRLLLEKKKKKKRNYIYKNKDRIQKCNNKQQL